MTTTLARAAGRAGRQRASRTADSRGLDDLAGMGAANARLRTHAGSSSRSTSRRCATGTRTS